MPTSCVDAAPTTCLGISYVSVLRRTSPRDRQRSQRAGDVALPAREAGALLRSDALEPRERKDVGRRAARERDRKRAWAARHAWRASQAKEQVDRWLPSSVAPAGIPGTASSP